MKLINITIVTKLVWCSMYSILTLLTDGTHVNTTTAMVLLMLLAVYDENFSWGGGGQGWWHLQNPCPLRIYFYYLYPPPVLRCFWKDPLMTPIPQHPISSIFHCHPLLPIKILIIHSQQYQTKRLCESQSQNHQLFIENWIIVPLKLEKNMKIVNFSKIFFYSSEH